MRPGLSRQQISLSTTVPAYTASILTRRCVANANWALDRHYLGGSAGGVRGRSGRSGRNGPAGATAGAAGSAGGAAASVGATSLAGSVTSTGALVVAGAQVVAGADVVAGAQVVAGASGLRRKWSTRRLNRPHRFFGAQVVFGTGRGRSTVTFGRRWWSARSTWPVHSYARVEHDTAFLDTGRLRWRWPGRTWQPGPKWWPPLTSWPPNHTPHHSMPAWLGLGRTVEKLTRQWIQS